MHLLEVLEGRRQLDQPGGRVAQVHAREIVALERVHEVLDYVVALRTAHGCVDGCQPRRVGHRSPVCGDGGAAYGVMGRPSTDNQVFTCLWLSWVGIRKRAGRVSRLHSG